jgi:hypothetical protein
VRYRSPQSVLDEMGFLIEAHGVREFHVVDDIFNADKKRAIAIFDGIVRRGWDVDLAFPNGLRADIMTEEFVAAARAAGAYSGALAVETATPRLQKLVQKHNRLERVFETIALSARHDVIVATFNMLGFPTETEAEMRATIDFNLRSDAHAAYFFKVTPFQGTGLWDQVVAAGAVPPEDMVQGYSNYRDGRDRLCEVPPARIEQLILDCYRRFYFDPARLARFVGLTERGHPARPLAMFLEDRLRSIGIAARDVPDRRARELAFALLERGGRSAGIAARA